MASEPQETKASSLRPVKQQNVLRNDHLHYNLQTAIYGIQPFAEDTSETTAYDALNRDEQAHIELLDKIALLLVERARADVVATAFEAKTADRVAIYYARNAEHEESKETRSYINNLIAAFQTRREHDQILPLVIKHCHSKINASCNKLHKHCRIIERDALGETDFLKLEQVFYYGQWSEMVRYQILGGKSNIEPWQWMDDLLRSCTQENPDDDQLRKIVILCNKVTRMKPSLDDFGVDPWIIRGFQKISDYRQILRTIGDMLRRSAIRTIDIIFLPAPPRTKQVVQVRHVEAFNIFTTQFHGGLTYTFEQIKIANPDYEEPKQSQADIEKGVPPKATRKLKCCVHAELIVALRMLQTCSDTNIKGQKIFLGVSKASCAYCMEWLTEMNFFCGLSDLEPQVITRATHHKRYDGWTPPSARELGYADADLEELTQNCNLAVSKRMLRIAEIIHQVVGSRGKYRRSDSVPRHRKYRHSSSGEMSEQSQIP